MHPALIPEKHPMCGQIMEALMKCREDNQWGRFLGACNEHTWELSRCLVVEKKVARADRQAKYQQQWRQKRADDEARMQQLDAQAAERAAEAESRAVETAGSSDS